MKIKFPEQLKTQKEKFDYLVKNKDFIVNAKKSTLKHCDVFNLATVEKRFIKDIQTKAIADLYGGDTLDTVHKTIAMNTLLWLDSHDDVHIPGLFTKTISENQKNIPHLHDHIFELDCKVGIPQKIYEQAVSWAQLGVEGVEGNTVVICADSAIKKDYNSNIFAQYIDKQINQHSIAERYVNMFLCINDPDYKEYFASWQKYVAMGIGNIGKVIEQGYFWAITEAQIKEFSCVFRGSNELTPVLEIEEETSDNLDNKDKPEPNNFTRRKRKPELSTSKRRRSI